MATWRLDATRENLHGRFSREIPPVLTIDPGDSVVFQTLDAGWFIEPRQPGKPAASVPHEAIDNGHCLNGPIFIRSASPGKTLAVRIDEVRVGRWGWTVSGGWPHPVHERLGFAEGPDVLLAWTLDADKGVGRNQHGHEVPLRPFLGVMGMPPDEPGNHPTPPPRVTGGNLDCKELVAGTTLYLPIAVEGGLFSAGDGHAAQGDGEICVTAIECGMERAVLTFDVIDQPLKSPRARTADAWITFGLHEDLQEACYLAIDAMLDLMVEKFGLDRAEAMPLASVCVDFRITQIVNGVRGVHAILRDDAITIPPQGSQLL